MRALGLDIGATRVGVAISDPSGRVASPIAVLDAREVARDPHELIQLAEDYEIESLVVGLPLTLSGDEGPQAAEVRDVAERLAAALGVPVEYQDERLSSAEAKRWRSLGEKEEGPLPRMTSRERREWRRSRVASWEPMLCSV